jgi:uncharacterized OB-fold protein
MAMQPIDADILLLSDGAHEPRLRACRCDGCGTVFHPPRPVCLACHGRALHETSLSGAGTLHACTHVAMKLRPGMRATSGYWVAQVDLDDGPRVQGLLAAELTEPRIGMRLRLGVETIRAAENGDEIAVHHFADEDAAS